MTLIRKTACTCDRERPETFDPACPKHGDGTWAAAYRDALNRGDWSTVERLEADRGASV